MTSSPRIRDLFIPPGVDIQPGDPEYITAVKLKKDALIRRWDSSTGRNILDRWKANDFSRAELDGLVGKVYGYIDIRGIPLIREQISHVDLSRVEFYAANLEGTQFHQVNLTDTHFSEANLKGTEFRWCQMDNVFVDNVQFNSKTLFEGVNLNTINFNLAVLLQDLAIGQQRIAHLEKRTPIIAKLLKITCDYGRSFTRFFLSCLFVTLFFGVLYYLIPNSISQKGIWHSLYFSALTFVTVGIDIKAVSLAGKILMLVESVIGYLMTGLLVAILVKRTVGEG